MAIFSNKIIEASFTNKDQNQIEILYKEDDKIYPYHIQVNHNHPDFQDLIKEYSLEKIQEITRQKIESRIREVERANIKDLDRIKTEIFDKANNFTNWYDFLFHFDEKDSSHMNFLFELKLKLFDEKKVKEMSEDKKNLIRDSLSPLEIIKCLM